MPLHFDRLRWWGVRQGSRGEVQRMRAMPVVRGEMAGREGKDNGQEIAKRPVGALPAPLRSAPRAGKRDGTIIQTTADNLTHEDNNQAISLDRRGNMA